MIDPSILQVAGSLGVGALLASMIFVMYRLDRKSSEKRLSSIIEADQESREANTKALTELVILLRRMNGRH